jgi:hypothetical protein
MADPASRTDWRREIDTEKLRRAQKQIRAGDLNAKMLDRLDEVYGKIDPRDLPGAVRNLATVAGIHEDKRALRDEQATGPHIPTRSVKDILDALDGKGVKLTLDFGPSDGETPEPAIEGTATESSPHPSSPHCP